MSRSRIFLMSGLALFLPIECSARSSSSLFQFGSKKMSGICTSRENLHAIGADALGFHKNRISRNAETKATDDFALASAPRMAFQVKDVRWQREIDDQGRCLLSLILTIPPDLAGRLGGVSPLSGNVELRLRKAGGTWVRSNEFQDSGIHVNEFEDYFRPYIYAEIDRQIAEQNRQEADRQRAEAQARKQAEAEAEAAFKRDFPREWVAEQERLRAQKQRRQQQERERQIDEQRKAQACEANGGTWGYKVRNGVKISQTGCFFRISE